MWQGFEHDAWEMGAAARCSAAGLLCCHTGPAYSLICSRHCRVSFCCLRAVIWALQEGSLEFKLTVRCQGLGAQSAGSARCLGAVVARLATP